MSHPPDEHATAPELPGDFSGYRCPTTGSRLSFEGDPQTRTGVLRNERGQTYRVQGGLPRFVADEGYSSSFGYQWQIHARSQVDSATGSSLSRDRFFRGTRWPESMPGERVLEVGCGSGRFTEVLLSTGAEVWSLDYSLAADVTHAAFGDRARVCQASVYEMPYVPASFDRVFCYGVIQHCPDVRRAFDCLVKMVRPGGHLAVDVYDARRWLLNARYRVRWLTKRLPKQALYRAVERIVPLYMRIVPPLHPYNQLLVPIKDYRGTITGLSLEQQIENSILDTFDALSPEHDHPQFRHTMRNWCQAAGLTEIEVEYGGNGIEVRARKPPTHAP